MIKLNKIVTGIAFAASMSCGAAMAASNGTLGANSTGSTDISLSIGDRVQISSVENIALGTWSGSGAMTGTTEFCVYRSGGDDYRVTLSTDTGAFLLNSALTGDNIAFSAKIDDDLDASDGESAGYNTPTLTALAGSTSFTCGGSDNAEIEVTFAEAALQAASSSNDYQATMTIYVEPI